MKNRGMDVVRVGIPLVISYWALFGTARPRRVRRILRVELPERPPAAGFVAEIRSTLSGLQRFFWFACGSIYAGLVALAISHAERPSDMWRVAAIAGGLATPVAVIAYFWLFVRLALYLDRVSKIRPRLVTPRPLVIRVGAALFVAYLVVISIGLTVLGVVHTVQ